MGKHLRNLSQFINNYHISSNLVNASYSSYLANYQLVRKIGLVTPLGF